MDNRTGKAALAALFVSAFITGCGGGGGSEAAAPAPAPAPSGGPGTVSVDGVATPQTVSVVTAKNAD